MTTATTTFDWTRPVRTLSDRTNDIGMSLVIGFVLTGFSYLVGVIAGWITEVNWLEAFAVFANFASTWQFVKQRRIAYAFGAIATAAYGVLFLQFELYASMILNFYLAFSLIYGYIRWGKDDNPRKISWLIKSPKWIPVYLVVTAGAYVGAVFLIQAFGGALPFFDAAILALTILAQFLLDNKRIETWIIWAAVNVIAIGVYFTAGLTLVGFQYIFFLLNAFYAFYVWFKAYRNQGTKKYAEGREGIEQAIADGFPFEIEDNDDGTYRTKKVL